MVGPRHGLNLFQINRGIEHGSEFQARLAMPTVGVFAGPSGRNSHEGFAERGNREFFGALWGWWLSRSNVTSLGQFSRRANKREAADFFGINAKTLDAWIRHGAPVAKRGGLGQPWVLDLLDLCRWRFERGQSAFVAQEPENMEPLDRKAWYESESKRRDLQDRDRDLLRSIEVEEALGRAYATLRECLLSIPEALKRTHGVAPEIAALVKEDVSAALQTTASRLGCLATVGE